MAILFWGLGEAVLRFIVQRRVSAADNSFLAVPTGMIVFSGCAQFAANLSLPVLHGIYYATIGLAVAGGTAAFASIRPHLRQAVPWGWGYIAVIALVGVTHYLPLGQYDCLRTADGGMRWAYVDCSFQQAITGLLMNVAEHESPPPKVPGFACQKLNYHYGRNAAAGLMASMLGMSSADVTARAMPWLALLSLAGLAVYLGRRTAPDAPLASLAGLSAVALVFLLPSLASVCSNIVDTSIRHPLIVIPWFAGPLGHLNGWDGAWAHFFLSGSGLWGSLVACTVLALMVSVPEGDAEVVGLPWGPTVNAY